MSPRDLVRILIDKGVLTDHRVAGALASVPRERFVPEHRRDEAYEDKVVITKWDESGVAISSASQPAMVAIMLEQLRLEERHSVLEIGAGTGFNAALLGRLADRVITMDIDEDVARNARRHLSGSDNVEVRVGDGWAGVPEQAPYDRIELTIGTSDISPAWRDQLVDGGLLVLPLWLRVGVQVSVAFRRDGDVLRGENVRDCGFQRLRGPHSGPEGFVGIGGGEFIVLDDASTARPVCELLKLSPYEEPAPVIDPEVFARLALDEPRTLAISDLSGALRPGLHDEGSVVVVDPERMLTYGTPVARDRFVRALGTGRPLDRSRLCVTVSFGDPPPPSQGWRFVRPSCVVDVAEGR
jgi:protein-L-isoaspartate(D-aspartate) O-methyltransferase